MNEAAWNELMKDHNKKIDGIAKKLLKKSYGSLSWEDLANASKLFIWESFNVKHLIETMARRYMLNLLRHEKVETKYREAYVQAMVDEGLIQEGEL